MKWKLLLHATVAVLFLCAIGGCERQGVGSPADGHGRGGEHGPGDDEEDGPEPIVVTKFTSKVELFMEYPHLVKGEPARFLAHLTVLDTGEPVRSGTLTCQYVRPGGQQEEVTVEQPARDGLFIPEITFDQAGAYGNARLVVQSPQVEETIELGELTVHPDPSSALAAAAAEGGDDDPTDVVPFLMEQQWKIGSRLARATQRTLSQRLQVPGQIEALPEALAVVSPPVAGRLIRAGSGKLPAVGEHVTAGQVLGQVEMALPETDVAQLRANQAAIQSLQATRQSLQLELLLRAMDIDLKALDVERTISASQTRLEFARNNLKRVSALREKGLGTEQQRAEAKRDLDLATSSYQAALELKKAYQEALKKLENLRAMTATVAVPKVAAETAPTAPEPLSIRLPLAAPLTGQIITAKRVEGEQVDAHEEVFRILNTERVLVVAHVSEFDLGAVGELLGAVMTLDAYPGKQFDILGSAGGRLFNIGATVDEESRTVPIRYEMPNPRGLLRVGMFCNVFLETQQSVDAVAIPEQAIVMEHGRPTAYVLLDGENFQKRALELGVRDGGYVEVKRGVRDGERVATRGAYAIKIAAQGPASIGHGHAH